MLLEQLLFKLENFASKVGNARSLVLCDDQLSLQVGDLLLSADDFGNFLLIVDLSLVEGGLLDLDLLIEHL